jgi:branched-chain amino acid transport system permease protein
MFTVVVLGDWVALPARSPADWPWRDPSRVVAGLSDPVAEPRAVHRIHSRARDPAARARGSKPMKRWIVLAIVIAVASLLPLAFDARGYWIRVLSFTLLFAAMAQAWNIVGGLANQLSLGHAAFFGIGAYTSTILLVKFSITPWLGMLAGGALGAIAALVIAIPTMRLQGHYFALATLAFGEVMRVIANVWTSLTGGPGGLSVPFQPPSLSAYSFKVLRPHAYIALVALIVVTTIFEMIRRGAMGYRLRAIKENSAAAEVIGIDTAKVKLQAAVLSGALMGTRVCT